MPVRDPNDYSFLIEQIERVNNRVDRLEREIRGLTKELMEINVAKALNEIAVPVDRKGIKS